MSDECKFKHYETVRLKQYIINDRIHHNCQAIFIKPVTHNKKFAGKCYVILNTIQVMTEMDNVMKDNGKV